MSAHHFKAGVEKPNRNITDWLKNATSVTNESAENSENTLEIDEDTAFDISATSDSSASFIFEDEV